MFTVRVVVSVLLGVLSLFVVAVPARDGPDPQCVLGHGESLLDLLADREVPQPAADHSRRPPRRPDRACDESPLAGLEVER